VRREPPTDLHETTELSLSDLSTNFYNSIANLRSFWVNWEDEE
jgi:hypothetical protein